jgi:hypothetical protein
MATKAGGRVSGQRLVKMPFHAVGHFGQVPLGILQEMGSGTMRFERGIVFVLLVYEKPARFSAVPVDLVGDATRLLA